MHKTIIADTSCLIILSNIQELEILNKVYGEIVTTPEIASEFGDQLPPWISIVKVEDFSRQEILELQIDKGEASALALALEIKDCLVIIDDFRARKTAERLGINYTGTIGVIVRAKVAGVIQSIKPILAKIKATNFRISTEIESQALKASGEE
jgi:predicted nucleic acid-binding protein